jgi:hypothetical protein
MSHSLLNPQAVAPKNYHKLSEKKLKQFYTNNTSTTSVNNKHIGQIQSRTTTSKKNANNNNSVRSISLSRTAASGLAYVQKVVNPATIDISCKSCGRAIRW